MRVLLIALLAAATGALAADAPPGRDGVPRMPAQDSKCNDVPTHPFDIILSRPEADSVTISVLSYADAGGFIAYGTEPGKLTSKTLARAFKNGEPAEIVIPALKADTRYFYQLHIGQTTSPEYSFQTARPPGKAFTFTVTADSHLDINTDPAIYQNTLASALADKPDFHIDLGDTFMTEKHASRELDGVVYQEVPQPGHASKDDRPPRSAAEYGYAGGTILGGSGHMRVTVSQAGGKVEYVRTDGKAGIVVHSYTIGGTGTLKPASSANRLTRPEQQ